PLRGVLRGASHRRGRLDRARACRSSAAARGEPRARARALPRRRHACTRARSRSPQLKILERDFEKERGFFAVSLGQMPNFSWVPFPVMESWHLLTKHGRVLVCIARDPRIRLREIAEALDITERSAYALVGDLVAAGYIVTQREG